MAWGWKRWFVLGVKLLVAVGLMGDLLLLLPTTRGPLLALIDRKRTCPALAALTASRDMRQFNRTLERISEQVRLEREEDGKRLWSTPTGSYWMPASSQGLLPFLLTEQQMDIYGDENCGVHKGDVVLDCGAHVGVYTKKALSRGARLVVAIEPAPENLECLRRNLATEEAQGRVIIYPKGVWNVDARLPLHLVPENTGMDNVLGPAGDPRELVEITLTTIDRIVTELRLDRVDFIKMDIEGAERQALAGAAKTLATYKPRLAIAAYHLPDDHIAIPATVRRARRDYRMTCRACAFADGRLVPEVFFFH